MEEVEILKNVLVNTIQRMAKMVQSYEVEVANLSAEIIRLQKQLPNTEIKKL